MTHKDAEKIINDFVVSDPNYTGVLRKALNEMLFTSLRGMEDWGDNVPDQKRRRENVISFAESVNDLLRDIDKYHQELKVNSNLSKAS